MQVVAVFKSHIVNLCAIVFLSPGFRKHLIQSAPRSATSVALEGNIYGRQKPSKVPFLNKKYKAEMN